jgi:hypothetical protein
MEEETKPEAAETEGTEAEEAGKEPEKEGKEPEKKKAPVITRSMMEEACPTCGADAPSMPEVLPDPSWPTEKLVAALKDKHMLVRSNAVILLSKRSPSESLEPLVEALKDKEYLVKSNAMVCLAAYGPQVAQRMIEALSDPDQDVRAGAAWVLGELRDQRAIEHLERVAKDEYPLARIQAKASLVAMGRVPKKEEAKEAPQEGEADKSGTGSGM